MQVLQPEQQLCLIQYMTLLLNIIICTIINVVSESAAHQPHKDPEPYHTSVLSGKGWVIELLTSHPDHIQNELRMSTELFGELVTILTNHNHTNSRWVLDFFPSNHVAPPQGPRKQSRRHPRVSPHSPPQSPLSPLIPRCPLDRPGKPTPQVGANWPGTPLPPLPAPKQQETPPPFSQKTSSYLYPMKLIMRTRASTSSHPRPSSQVVFTHLSNSSQWLSYILLK